MRPTALLAPPIERVLQALTAAHPSQQLHLTATVGRSSQTHQVQLAGVSHPRGTVQRTVAVLAPPQPDVELARAHAPLIGVIEASERRVALAWPEVRREISAGHAPTLLSRRRVRSSDSLVDRPKPTVIRS
jgi:hypothetical protein